MSFVPGHVGRLLLPLLLALGLAAGCRTEDGAPERRTAPTATKGGGLGRTGNLTGNSTNRTEAAPVVLPASGRVHFVNPGLRFVVIDYTLGGMPTFQSLLNVYRGEEKVGVIRLSGPERNGFAAGDIVEGYVQVDDEVRLN